MEPYKNFKLAGYVYAYYLEGKTPAQIQADIDFYKRYVPMNKVCLLYTSQAPFRGPARA